MSTAEALSDPLRARLLACLADESSLTFTELVSAVEMPVDCARYHLDLLVGTGLVQSTGTGARRGYRLARPGTARVLAALARMGLTYGSAVDADLTGSRCGEHLGGALGARLSTAMESGRLLVRSAGAYRPTERGESAFAGIGLAKLRQGSIPLGVACIGAGAEERVHLGGGLGSAVAGCLFAWDWVIDRGEGMVAVTEVGRSVLHRALTEPFAMFFSMPIEEGRT